MSEGAVLRCLDILPGRNWDPVMGAMVQDFISSVTEQLEVRVRETFWLKLSGLSNNEVANMTECSERTVERHLRQIKKTIEMLNDAAQ